MTTFNPTIAIPAVYAQLKETLLITNNLSCVIAGGAIADHYFGKESSDIDVFLDHAYLLTDDYKKLGFTEFVPPTRQEERLDSYGDTYMVDIEEVDTKIDKVYKGELLGYSVDLVFVEAANMHTYIEKNFDQSIKCAYYNGEYHYMPAFEESIKKKKIFSVRPDMGEYVRAFFSAEKYGLGLDNGYELSRSLCEKAWYFGKLESIISSKTFEMVENTEGSMFDEDYDKDNANIGSLFFAHRKTNGRLWKRLRKIAHKTVIVDNKLTRTELGITIEGHDYKRFAQSVFNAILNSGGEDERAHKELHSIRDLSPEDFTKGTVQDSNGRTVRLGKHLHKVARLAKEDGRFAEIVKDLQIQFETRGTKLEDKVFFTGTKHALLHISTKTKWKSCQRMGPFMVGTQQNYGLLANLSGNTVVAYTTEDGTRSDNDTSKWSSRCLVRIGMDESLIVERVYTNVSHLDNALPAIAIALRNEGFDVHESEESARHFDSGLYITTPYGDTPYVSGKTEKGGYRQTGNHEALNYLALHKEIDRYVRNEVADELLIYEEAREEGNGSFYNYKYSIACIPMNASIEGTVKELVSHQLFKDLHANQITSYLSAFGRTSYSLVINEEGIFVEKSIRVIKDSADVEPNKTTINEILTRVESPFGANPFAQPANNNPFANPIVQQVVIDDDGDMPF